MQFDSLSPETSVESSQTDQWIKKLHDSTSLNLEIVGKLRPRLILVCRPEEINKPRDTAPQEILVPLCNEIREAVNKVEDSNLILQSIIRRLEI